MWSPSSPAGTSHWHWHTVSFTVPFPCNKPQGRGPAFLFVSQTCKHDVLSVSRACLQLQMLQQQLLCCQQDPEPVGAGWPCVGCVGSAQRKQAEASLSQTSDPFQAGPGNLITDYARCLTSILPCSCKAIRPLITSSPSGICLKPEAGPSQGTHVA